MIGGQRLEADGGAGIVLPAHRFGLAQPSFGEKREALVARAARDACQVSDMIRFACRQILQHAILCHARRSRDPVTGLDPENQEARSNGFAH